MSALAFFWPSLTIFRTWLRTMGVVDLLPPLDAFHFQLPGAFPVILVKTVWFMSLRALTMSEMAFFWSSLAAFRT